MSWLWCPKNRLLKNLFSGLTGFGYEPTVEQIYVGREIRKFFETYTEKIRIIRFFA